MVQSSAISYSDISRCCIVETGLSKTEKKTAQDHIRKLEQDGSSLGFVLHLVVERLPILAKQESPAILTRQVRRCDVIFMITDGPKRTCSSCNQRWCARCRQGRDC